MKSEIACLQENMDSWVKEMRSEIDQLRDISNIVQEHEGNIEHNYELINEVKKDVEELKQEIKMLRVIQLMILKTKVLK